jgi:signal transduction histidine kinase
MRGEPVDGEKERISVLETELVECEDANERLELLVKLAELYWKDFQYANSIENAKKVYELAKRLNNVYRQSYACNLMGLNYIYLDNYERALDYLLRALKLSKKVGNKTTIADILNNVGQIYEKMNDHDRALGYFLESIKYNDAYHRPYNNAGIIFKGKNENEKALEYMWAAIRIARKSGETRSVAITSVNIADIYLKQQDYENALKYFLESLELIEKLQEKYIMVATLIGLGTVYSKMSKPEQALEYLIRAEGIASQVQSEDLLKDSYRMISDIYYEMKNYSKAYEYLKKFSEIKEKIYTDDLAKKVSEIQSSFEKEKKELEAMQVVDKASRLASIGVMAAGITHEINQPLNAIKIAADSVLFWHRRNPGNLPEFFLDEMKQISGSAQRIDDIIRHMRSFWINPEIAKSNRVELGKTLENAVSLINRQIFNHNIDLQIHLSEEELFIESNHIYIEQIIINLIVNSIQALDTEKKKDKKIIVRSFQQEGKAVIEIEDNATGVPLEIGDRLFDPFYTTKNKSDNTGLGLAIVKQMVDRYKGSINYRNNDMGGLSFYMEFPLLKEESEVK